MATDAQTAAESSENWLRLKGMVFGWLAEENRPVELNATLGAKFAETAERLSLSVPTGAIDGSETSERYDQAIGRLGVVARLHRPFVALIGPEANAESVAQSWAELVHCPYAEIDAEDPDAVNRFRQLVGEPVTLFVKNLPGSELAARSELRYDPLRGPLVIVDGEEIIKESSAEAVFASWPDQSAAPPSWGSQADLLDIGPPYSPPFDGPLGVYFAGPPLSEPFAFDHIRVIATAQALLGQQSSWPELQEFAVSPRLQDLAVAVSNSVEQLYQSFGAAPSEEQLGAAIAAVAQAYAEGYTADSYAIDRATQWMAVGMLSPYAVDKQGYKRLVGQMAQTFSGKGLSFLGDLLAQSAVPPALTELDAAEVAQPSAAGPSLEL